ncbi:LlaJI family restriction endonuclease [Fibrobacter sp. UWH1]|uniref:LlaJI family restriction endonuclease n=1 Tax=Fibrobacter sp. UWH1 TaxID=1964354 RepID=UPI000B51EB07|nr:LlaJI family restriction endonuclease [Fibrobacter sp. UWH1]OWV14720.1 hypothetical protein B7992_07200 [Fibrobacter sp. UWH1]
MIFLFEQFPYSVEYLKSVLPLDKEGRFKDLPNGFITRDGKLDGVGYLFNGSKKGEKLTDSIVFVLPKVFLDSSPLAQNDSGRVSAFGKEVSPNSDFKLDDAPKDFLANLSLWVSSSIGKYREAFPTDRAMDAPNARGFSTDKACPTLIDVKNAMERFYSENRNLFAFVSKNIHSGNNRVDWRRTMRKMPVLVPSAGSGTLAPVYMELVNKKKVFDLDDRLIVLYFSAMNYIEETFGFKMPKSEFYAPMRVNEFRRLLGHRGIMELRRIKHKYFADKFLRLYNIMKAFFEWGGNFSACGFGSEYLLTSKYNNVFEHMIDKLVGDDLPSKMAHLKNQKDGKEIDHLYKDQQLVFADESQKIWFIGDSKYYSDKNDIVGESVYKQFTYARNIIQYNISDLLNYKGDSKDYQGLRYRDSLTEGYSVTPNFFIRGEVPADKIFEMPAAAGAIRKDDADLWNERNRHFENRLFDRDTLLLQVYNVNFLYVLKAFTAKSSSLRTEFKRTAREKFRRNFIQQLRDRYYFWIVWVKDSIATIDKKDKISAFVDKHYRILQGKLFRTRDNADFLVLALEKVFVQKEGLPDDDPTEFERLAEAIKGDCEVFRWDAEDFVNDQVPSKKSKCREKLEKP